MKTHTVHWPLWPHWEPGAWQIRIPAMVITIRDMVAALSAVATALVIVLLAVWVSTFSPGYALAGATWGAAVVFLALAVDGRGVRAAMLVVTAAALVGLAWLQTSVAGGFVALAAALVAPWVSAAVFRWLK